MLAFKGLTVGAYTWSIGWLLRVRRHRASCSIAWLSWLDLFQILDDAEGFHSGAGHGLPHGQRAIAGFGFYRSARKSGYEETCNK